MKTWKDNHDLQRNVQVRAPCCGRAVAADMLIDARSLPDELRGPNKADYLCDACRERLFLTGQVTREAFHASDPAASPQLLAKMRRIDEELNGVR